MTFELNSEVKKELTGDVRMMLCVHMFIRV